MNMNPLIQILFREPPRSETMEDRRNKRGKQWDTSSLTAWILFRELVGRFEEVPVFTAVFDQTLDRFLFPSRRLLILIKMEHVALYSSTGRANIVATLPIM